MRSAERKKSQERAKFIRERLDREFRKSRLVLMGVKALRWEMERLVGQNTRQTVLAGCAGFGEASDG